MKHLEYSKPELTIYQINVEDIMLDSSDRLTPEDDLLLSVDDN